MENSICRERILSQEYMDFIFSPQEGRVGINIPDGHLCRQTAEFGYQIVYVDKSAAGPLTFERFSYNSIPLCYGLLDIEAMSQAGITQVQNYPTLQLMGEDIMIGFIDTGIDYTNPVFRKLDGTTRVAGIWDQTIQTGKSPGEFVYGSEYTEEMINAALQAEDPISVVPSMDENGHGTFVASIAAGSGNAEVRFLGAAPESTIAVVKLKEAKNYLKQYYEIQDSAVCYQENDIMLAIKYLNQLAASYDMPLIICIALGTNMGGHNATSPLAVTLEMNSNILRKGIVIGAGNEANQRHHFFGVLEGMQDMEEVEVRVGENVDGFVAEVWTDIPNIITISIISPSGERIPSIPIRQSSGAVFSFLFEQTRVFVDYRILVERNSSQLIFIRFEDPAPGIWRIVVEPIQITEGTFHIWLPIQEFLSGEVNFLQSNPYTTITVPSSVPSAITVGFYNGVNNSIDINSGRGYTRSGRIKPDFAAPGVDVLGAGLGGRFVRRTGSSVAAGIAAGATALLMEWVVFQSGKLGADTLQLKNLFILGTDQKPNLEYPNREWGYGSMNLFQTLDRIRQL